MKFLYPTISEINMLLDEYFPDSIIHGLCIQVRKEQELLIKDIAMDNEAVYLNDAYSFNCYHRVIGEFRTEDRDQGGFDPHQVVIFPVQIVCMSKNPGSFGRVSSILQRLGLKIESGTLDHNELMQREFGGDPTGKFDFEKFRLFSIVYLVETESEKCFDYCDDC